MQPLIDWVAKVIYEWHRGRIDPSDAFLIALAGLVLLIVLAGML